jgi:hypothetical protein
MAPRPAFSFSLQPEQGADSVGATGASLTVIAGTVMLLNA